MKSAVFYGKHELRGEEFQVPEPGRGEALIKVMACGICGTDVHIYEGDKGAADTPSGTILGHEFSGVIERVGEGVTGFFVGDRVCVDPNQMCRECDYCRNALGHFCEHMVGIGTTVHGGFSQYCAVPVSQLYGIADEITYEEAAMAEPVSCCLHGIDMCEIIPGSTVLVIGGGMIGLLMLQLAKLAGAGRLILLEPVKEKREMGCRLGADLAVDPVHQDVEECLRLQKVDRIHTVIECVGRPSTIELGIRLAGKKSTVMMFGLTGPEETVAVAPYELFKKEITLKSSFINPYTQSRAVELINRKKIDVSSMIHECIPLEELESVLGSQELRSVGKYIVHPWD